MTILVVILIIAIIVYNSNNRVRREGSQKYVPRETGRAEAPGEEQQESGFSIEGAYQSRWLFTQNEKRAYYKLNEIAQKHDLVVFAKVRLLDLVEPVRNHSKYKTNFYRVQAKHVDFVLAKNNLVARYVIELDDSSHDTKERGERDAFVDKVLTACGYKVLRTREISEEDVVKLIGQKEEAL